jgi:rhodanese-related sulfurtransferase
MLLDVRERWEFDIARIGGAVNVPMDEIPAAATRGELGATDSEIVVICHHGVRSQQVAAFLEQNGFSNLTNLMGGIDAWSRDVDSQVPTY